MSCHVIPPPPLPRRPVIIAGIIAVAGAYVTVVGLDMHRKSQMWGALYAAFLLLVGGLMCHAVREFAAVGVFKSKLEAAYAKCAKDIELDSDLLGPEPLSTSDVVQKVEDGLNSVRHYIIQAEKLSTSFELEVLAKLADVAMDLGGEVTSATVLLNLKTREVSTHARTPTISSLRYRRYFPEYSYFAHCD